MIGQRGDVGEASERGALGVRMVLRAACGSFRFMCAMALS